MRAARIAVVTALAISCTAPPVPTTAQTQCGIPEPGEALPVDVELPHAVTTGAGVGIALVDTGASSPGVIPGGEGDRDHCILHGTAVAGVLRTVAPDAVIISHRQVTDSGTGTVASLVDALDRAVAHAQRPEQPPVRVITMSLVACEDTAELRRAVAAAEDAGLLLVAAAGNTGQCAAGQSPYPAALPGVLTVGGVDARDDTPGSVADLGAGRQLADYSAEGPWVALAAPGGPVSTVLESEAGVRTIVGDPEPFTGTSFATPVVAATAALVWQVRPSLSAAEMRSLLVETATPGPVPVVDPAAAVAAVMDAEPVAAAGGTPWPVTVTPVARAKESVDLRVPVVLAALLVVGLLGMVVRRRPRA
ncbi:S8 family peptidase [Corynebacterium terpenotabidum]|uniref:Putative serine proteinase n=1 Tax=Corynebacterium terpenotabidum Y-11 TaxID=1200352 RepID=S4XEG3_9CORY|nr:S8 family serine peptidase [Corynebacterium terpenotabidum]AGP31532.1 putative serine proteinase [Corynebacterium terpenotabidum Y-11]